MSKDSRNSVDWIECVDHSIRFRNGCMIGLDKLAVAHTRRTKIRHDDMWCKAVLIPANTPRYLSLDSSRDILVLQSICEFKSAQSG